MKTFIASLLLTTTAFAQPQVPTELQEKILKAIEARCERVYNLNEVETLTRVVRIDQGQTDYYYTTTFSASWYFDGSHPIKTTITVESEDLAIYNPSISRLNVLSVTGDACN